MKIIDFVGVSCGRSIFWLKYGKPTNEKGSLEDPNFQFTKQTTKKTHLNALK